MGVSYVIELPNSNGGLTKLALRFGGEVRTGHIILKLKMTYGKNRSDTVKHT